MTTKQFKTLAIGLGSGGIGGAVSGSLLGLTIGAVVGMSGAASGNWAAFGVIPLFGFMGAMYGTVAGIVAGLLGSIILLARGAVEQTPRLAIWLGRLVGAGITAAFPIGGALPLNDSGDYFLLGLALPAALVGAMIGHAGGRVGGELAQWLLQVGGEVSAETTPNPV